MLGFKINVRSYVTMKSSLGIQIKLISTISAVLMLLRNIDLLKISKWRKGRAYYLQKSPSYCHTSVSLALTSGKLKQGGIHV